MTEAAPPRAAIHATAVAVAGDALVIRGPSRSGKSSLALALVAHSRPERPIRLVGDDRVLLHRRGPDVLASPHPRIAGRIEHRGCGILSLPYCSEVPVLGLVDLAPAAGCDLSGQNFPRLLLVDHREWDARAARVLSWIATLAARPRAKDGGEFIVQPEDWNW